MLGHWDYSSFPCWLGHQSLTSRKCWRDEHIRNTFSSWFKHFWLYLSTATKMGFRAQRIPGDRCLNLTRQGEAEEYILGLFLGFALNIEGEKMHWLQGLSRLPPHALHSGWLVRQFKQHLGQSCSPEPSWLFPALPQFLRERPLSLGSFFMLRWKQPDFTPGKANAKGLTVSAVSLRPLVSPTLRN